jgi:choline kinase
VHRAPSTREKDAWRTFKYEILRLVHTLKLGWRRVPLESSDKIEVERLSGALTNAVYVVSPPTDLPKTTGDDGQPRPRVPKLLLRIYGSQVDHLIDRESELQILRRLARKRIGPRMLGTFKNGRFEEFFNAQTLTMKDLRVPDTSRSIAKRMRELHDGVELLDSEVAAGPFVWQNIDKWMARCEKVVEWVESAIARDDDGARKLRIKGHLCGAEFELFKEALKRYRKWLEEMYGGWDEIKDRLVFAHNDVSYLYSDVYALDLELWILTVLVQAQYGNILRLIPDGESPLLLPANEHKRLIVIDFEYANANPPGLEFANHFVSPSAVPL